MLFSQIPKSIKNFQPPLRLPFIPILHPIIPSPRLLTSRKISNPHPITTDLGVRTNFLSLSSNIIWNLVWILLEIIIITIIIIFVMTIIVLIVFIILKICLFLYLLFSSLGLFPHYHNILVPVS